MQWISFFHTPMSPGKVPEESRFSLNLVAWTNWAIPTCGCTVVSKAGALTLWNSLWGEQQQLPKTTLKHEVLKWGEMAHIFWLLPRRRSPSRMCDPSPRSCKMTMGPVAIPVSLTNPICQNYYSKHLRTNSFNVSFLIFKLRTRLPPHLSHEASFRMLLMLFKNKTQF